MKSFLGFLFTVLCLDFCAYAGSPVHYELIGGVEAPDGAYPELVYVTSNGANCSASIISPEGSNGVVLTAAHCVRHHGDIGPVAEVFISVEEERFVAKCHRAPLYRQGKEDHDLALCKANAPFHVKPANIASKGPNIGESVRVMGYGCTKADDNDNTSGGNNGVLRIGEAKVAKVPNKRNWFETNSTVRSCYGDSGAPSMVLNDSEHIILGVTSQGDLRSRSLFTAVYTQKSLEFFQKFANDEKVDICGITQNCE